jgi:hypothetical protein
MSKKIDAQEASIFLYFGQFMYFTDKKLPFQLLVVINALTVTYLLQLGYFNQPALDDYCILAVYKSHGFHSPITYWYQNWNGRFLPLYVTNFWLMVFEKNNTLFYHALFMVTSYIFAIYRLLNTIFKPKTPYNKWYLGNLGVFIFWFFLINNFKFNTFFWLNASTMYHIIIFTFILGLNEIIRSEKKWYSWPIIVVMFFYTGSGTENHSLVLFQILLGLAFFHCLYLYKNKQNLGQYLSKYLVAIVTFSVSFAILFLAPGSKVRMQQVNPLFHGLSFQEKIPIFFSTLLEKYGLFVLEIGIFYIPMAVFFIVSFSYLWSQYSNAKVQDMWLFKYIKHVHIWIIAFLFSIFTVAPSVYVFGNIGTQRILIISSAVFAFCLVLSSLKLVNSSLLTRYQGLFKYLTIMYLVGIGVRLTWMMVQDTPVLIAYKNYEENKRKEMAALKANPVKTGAKIVYGNKEFIFSQPVSSHIIRLSLEALSPKIAKQYYNVFHYEPILTNHVIDGEQEIFGICIQDAYENKNIVIEDSK